LVQFFCPFASQNLGRADGIGRKVDVGNRGHPNAPQLPFRRNVLRCGDRNKGKGKAAKAPAY
jgi:hypothetical protein